MSDENEIRTIVEFSEDVSSAEAPPLLPTREYVATIEKAVVMTSQKDTLYAAVTFHISPDEYPADFDAASSPEGKTLTYRRISLEDNAAARFRLRKFCTAIGAPMSKRIDLGTWTGLTAKVAIAHSPFEGELREDISKVSAA